MRNQQAKPVGSFASSPAPTRMVPPAREVNPTSETTKVHSVQSYKPVFLPKAPVQANPSPPTVTPVHSNRKTPVHPASGEESCLSPCGISCAADCPNEAAVKAESVHAHRCLPREHETCGGADAHHPSEARRSSRSRSEVQGACEAWFASSLPLTPSASSHCPLRNPSRPPL